MPSSKFLLRSKIKSLLNMINRLKFYFKKYYIYFFSRTVITKSNISSCLSNQSIGIAIPLTINHFKFLDQLLTFISKSEILPAEVSVCISSSTNLNINFDNLPFNLIITQTRFFQNASQNRNTAARKLNTDIISFFDADDIPHIKRLSYIQQAFINGSSVCVHNYQQNPDRNYHFPFSDIGQIKYYHNSINSKGINCLFPICITSWQNYACGHITVSREIFNRFKFNEHNIYLYREDAEYASRLVENNIFISYIENTLSFYVK